MRSLSERSADRCETAVEKRCRCRCGGKLHGAKRGNVRELSFDDPHSPAKPCWLCSGTGKLKYKNQDQCHQCGGKGKVLP